jgi:hypothetical protein
VVETVALLIGMVFVHSRSSAMAAAVLRSPCWWWLQVKESTMTKHISIMQRLSWFKFQTFSLKFELP